MTILDLLLKNRRILEQSTHLIMMVFIALEKTIRESKPAQDFILNSNLG
ncbi:hypothetical protein [Atribacter laminatus]|nr:hypothetical protein [Atribacter laminatus]